MQQSLPTVSAAAAVRSESRTAARPICLTAQAPMPPVQPPANVIGASSTSPSLTSSQPEQVGACSGRKDVPLGLHTAT